MSEKSKHPSDQQLQGFAAGQLDEQDWDYVELHLTVCEECASRIAHFPANQDNFLGALKEAKANGEKLGKPPDQNGQAGRVLKNDVPFPTEPSDAPVQSLDSGETDALPRQIGRFRIERILGKGGFGVVYLGHDEQLQRKVAIKVPKPQFVHRAEDRELYLKEARTVAGLEHPNIVPVLEVGSTPEFPIYIVSKFIVGKDLAARLKMETPSNHQAVQWMIDLADALREAHRKGFVHRDVKPQNILVDQDERVYLVDFGLALADQDVGKRLPAGGTPAYMSPEQARGEGHRVDGRSDLFSLGILFYEMLCGRRPFQGNSQVELFEQITDLDPKPLRQWVDSIPQELERICFKMLAKRKSERYSSAKDLADDLKVFLTKSPLKSQSMESIRSDAVKPSSSSDTKRPSDNATPVAHTPTSDSRSLKIVPKGLRSFDHLDADFFLELLPGARDRGGLPESVRFWKSRIEERELDQTFAVGLVYGPSGCGKSSMVKAGLLPRLTPDVVVIYLEATPDDTERTLLTLIRRKLDSKEVESTTSLVDILHEIRRGRILPRGKKLLIVIDQFEQWLFAHPNAAGEPLLESLLQCDGSRVQAIVMVRDDFWMAATRFFRDLDIPLLERINSAAVDLFDADHAERVLKAFGRAFGKLEFDGKEDKQDRKQFITEAVNGLSENGKVISVRLSLFAEMMKGRPWTPESLREVGGTTGVGATFLEETFSASGAPPQHRYHQEAARAVLRTLLPEAGTDIKGHKRSTDELRAACRYDSCQRDFDDLIRILDSELRLITPVDNTEPQAIAATTNEAPRTRLAPAAQYQLTHDYLVPSLRDWLTRKQRETRRGRAELKLVERAYAWNALRENKQLPTLWEWLSIRTWTDQKQSTGPQRSMMQKANGFHLSRLSSAAMIVGLITAVGLWTWNRVDGYQRDLLAQKAIEQKAIQIEGLVETLVSADPSRLPEIAEELDANHQVATKFLSPLVSADSKTVDEKRSQLHARLATVARDKSLVEPLLEELLTNKVSYIGPIRQQLSPYAGDLTEKLWTILRDDNAEGSRRFRAALVLADYVPQSDATSWTEDDLRFVAEQLVGFNSEYQQQLRELLRPLSTRLLGDLEKIFSDPMATENQRLSAAKAFVDYAAKDVRKLVQLLIVATPEQYAILYPLIVAAKDAATNDFLKHMVRETPGEKMHQSDRISLGRRRAGAAITLLRQGERESIFDVLRVSTDTESLSQFVAGCKSRGVAAKELLNCVDKINISRQALKGAERKTEDQVLYGLLLALGDYPFEQVPVEIRSNQVERLVSWYATDPSSGIHGASGWLLRRWNFIDEVIRVNQTPIAYDPSGMREWFTLEINPETDDSSTKAEPANSSIYFTFIVFPAGEYVIGSPDGEFRRGDNENMHRVKLSRPVAVSDRELTWQQFDPYDNRSRHTEWEKQLNRILGASDPSFGISWYKSITYCRWLTAQSKLAGEVQCYDDPSRLEKDENGDPKYSKIYLNRSGFRLPTEAEWEVVCRSGTQTAYSFGNDEQLLGDYGWFQATSREWSHPVGFLRPGPRGLFDVHGNVDEWCHDWFVGYDLNEVNLDPLGAEKGSFRVHRGGSWYWDAGNCRSACRNGLSPSNRVMRVNGLRIALSPPSKSP